MVNCWGCDKTFASWQSACQHMNAVGHWECETCSNSYWDMSSANDHMDDWNHWRPRFECETCDNVYWSEAAAHRHMERNQHWLPRFKCEACPFLFETQNDARRHMDSTNHWRTHFCTACQKGFQNVNNYKQHLNSNIHRGNQITCPFCRRGFATATGVTVHLETGSCPKASGLNHDTILREIRRRDPGHLITKKLLTYESSETTTTVTASTYNRRTGKYECYICHRGFGSLQGLNQHVNSPTHRQHVYHCPGRNCNKEFKALSSLFNHLESEKCGAVRFETVQRNVGGFLGGGQGLIGFR